MSGRTGEEWAGKAARRARCRVYGRPADRLRAAGVGACTARPVPATRAGAVGLGGAVAPGSADYYMYNTHADSFGNTYADYYMYNTHTDCCIFWSGILINITYSNSALCYSNNIISTRTRINTYADYSYNV